MKSSGQSISPQVVKRLPRYYRYLEDMLAEGLVRTSSKELSAKSGLTASQIRQDLNCFGGFGQQGYGYNIAQLHNEIGKILALDKKNKTILIGAGNLGRAVAAHMDFAKKGFVLIGIFDKNEAASGQLVNGIPIRHISGLDDFCLENKPVIAVLCVPKERARELTENLIRLGIKGFWNFTHFDIGNQFPQIAVENVHLSDSLMTLCYKLDRLGDKK
ncbi:MAG: Redox-sensing transcriptional repressor Rex [Firmicutes bacterium ADurb.Bin300]|jgi:redox-sensing transcriptional repressor|nr:MAG: Redox-sensing transcriptional repressor Rex [Firmicutes bacterium ADurb.Bin300]